MRPRLRGTLAYIERCIAESGRSPSLKEIAAHFDLSVVGAQKRVCRLIARGYLARHGHTLAVLDHLRSAP